jgi:hypothetical protein
MEEIYWQTLRDLDLFSDVTPNNIATEKEKFFTAFKKGESYNPTFKYALIRENSDIEKLEKAFQYCPKDSEIFSLYSDHFLQEKKWLEAFIQREKSNFNSLLSNLYPVPEEKDIYLAEKILLKEDFSKDLILNGNPITAIQAKLIFENLIKELGFNDWTVELKQISAKAMVSTLKKQIFLRIDYQFSESEIERLKVHELLTHVQRFENGSKLPYALFRYGFPKYLETEEGLAIYNEEKNNVLSNEDLKKYALRLLACKWANNGGFEFVFNNLVNYTSENESWEIAMRVKRGLINTAENGGFFKDQLYLKGYLRVKKLNEEQIKKLWIGKIGIEHLDSLSSFYSK